MPTWNDTSQWSKLDRAALAMVMAEGCKLNPVATERMKNTGWWKLVVRQAKAVIDQYEADATAPYNPQRSET